MITRHQNKYSNTGIGYKRLAVKDSQKQGRRNQMTKVNTMNRRKREWVLFSVLYLTNIY